MNQKKEKSEMTREDLLAERTQLENLVATLADQIKAWEKYHREVNYAVDNYGSYKP